MGSYYKYGEATAHHPGNEASLESNVPFASGKYCLNLSMHMEGADIGSLSILTKVDSNKAVSQKQYSGEQGTHWFSISVELDLTPSTKKIIQTV